MVEYFLSPGNTPFTVALGLMVVMTVIEIISASLGMGLSEMVDSFLPELDADVDVDMDMDGLDGVDGGSAPGSLVQLLAWFRVGEVPVVMLFIVFLTGFGMSGLAVQYLMHQIVGFGLPTVVAVVIALAASAPTVRFCGGLLGKYMPQDETYAVSEKSFQGMVATLTLGTAKAGKPAQAKLRDKHGQTHYIMVEPDNPAESFEQGEKTIIVDQAGAIYKVIDASGSAMTDER
ncbi:YqiJ family protein [Desulfopila sp. IMCC35008]|uniref:YqiJ family protein n=1 Tax=Desulfopila sp. IMCC35008 TaxID=2653858 RepID=UPI0013D45D01|nr:YqiJ family protein [Desulfopila sp. IMCC35008]